MTHLNKNNKDSKNVRNIRIIDKKNETSNIDINESLDLHENNEINGEDISCFLSKIQNKYSGNAEQKHLNQLYDIGILCANKTFNHKKLVDKLSKIIEERSNDPIQKVRDTKRISLTNAFKKGIEDGSSEEYRSAYNNYNKYQYDSEKLKKRAHIDNVLNHYKLQ